MIEVNICRKCDRLLNINTTVCPDCGCPFLKTANIFDTDEYSGQSDEMRGRRCVSGVQVNGDLPLPV